MRKANDRNRASRRGGFTLVEVGIATAIIGIGVAALMVMVGSGTKVNAAGQKLTQAAFLAQEIREWTMRKDYATLTGTLNAVYAPPHDGEGNDIPNMAGWTQTVSIAWKNPANLAATGVTGPTDLVYVQVKVAFQNQDVLTTGWLVAKRQ